MSDWRVYQMPEAGIKCAREAEEFRLVAVSRITLYGGHVNGSNRGFYVDNKGRDSY